MPDTQVSTFENDIFYRILKWVLYALLLTPLWVWSVFLFPYITTKVIYFRLLVELALLFYIPLAFKYPALRPNWRSWLVRAVWIYFAVITIASIFGVDLYHSFWGTIERGEGLLTISHFVIYFTILAPVLPDRKTWSRYLHAALALISLNAVYGLFQMGCYGYVPGTQSSGCDFFLQTTGTRIAGTIGNAAFYAAFMLFGIFLAWYLLTDVRNRPGSSLYLKIYLAATILVQIFVLYETQTRGALLGFAAAVFIYALFSIFRGRSKAIKIGSLAVIVLVLAAGIGLYSGRNSNFVKSQNTLYRLSTISLSDTTTQSRLDTWRASWQGWKDRFFLGYGYENYNIAFNKYFPPQVFKNQGSQIWFDRAHDIFFDIGVTSGVVGLLAYFGIFAAAGVMLWRQYRKQSDGLSWQFPVILAVMLLAYFLQNLFVFDTEATYLMFFLILAYLVFLQKADASAEPAEAQAAQISTGARLISTGSLAIILVVAIFVNIKPALANYYGTIGIKESRLKSYRALIPDFQHAYAYHTYMSPEFRQKLVDYTNEALSSSDLSAQEQQDVFQFTVDGIKENIKAFPKDVKNYLYLMNLENRSPDPAMPDQVLALGQQAQVLSPTRPQLYFELGQAEFNKKNYGAGLDYFRKAIVLNPLPVESHFNYFLGTIIAGHPDLTADELKVITETLKHKFNADEYASIAGAYYQVGDKTEAVANYLLALALRPNDVQLRVKLIATYGAMCDIESVRAQGAELVQIDQTYASSVQAYLSQLAQTCKK